ncbi:MAG: hypothetical protein GEU79_09215 [Acidimicrobiia bacterium]|nr:hypothetical protein [Acidimicrobiia bacterium]
MLHFALALSVGGFVSGLCWIVLKPRSGLARRVRPYAQRTRVSLGNPADSTGDAYQGSMWGDSISRRLLMPVVVGLGRRLGTVATSLGEETLRLRLTQAGMFAQVPPEQRPSEFYARLWGRVLIGAAVGGLAGMTSGGLAALLLIGAGAFVGAASLIGAVDRAIATRREWMRAELYTVNQILAIRSRAAGSVPDLIEFITRVGRGEVVSELSAVWDEHRRGTPISEALLAAAEGTVEPQAARTYELLATAHKRGADLSQPLLDLSRDLRSEYRHEIQRGESKRRTAMAAPLILVMFPLALALLAGPIPSMIFESLGGG